MNSSLLNTNSSKKIAQCLLDVGAIKLQPNNPFTWASGWKSPIYCDNRVSLSCPDARAKIKDALVKLIRTEYPDAEAIAGVATGGIPQGVLVADVLGVPFIYVRSKPKDHGLINQIEGKVVKGQKVVVLEDLISTGGSSLAAVDALKDAEVEVLGIAAIFTYAFAKTEKNFINKNIRLAVLSDYPTLLSISNFDDEIKTLLSSWRKFPDTWGQ